MSENRPTLQGFFQKRQYYIGTTLAATTWRAESRVSLLMSPNLQRSEGAFQKDMVVLPGLTNIKQ